MASTKLIFGIFTILISIILGIQSGLITMFSIFSGDGSGLVGLLICGILLVAGIMAIVQRSNRSIAAIILYIVFGILAKGFSSNFPDLALYGNFSWFTALLFVVMNSFSRYRAKETLSK